MPLHLISSDDLRNVCRQKLESCELWLRRIVHDQLIPDFGTSYIQTAEINGQHIFRTEIRNHATALKTQHPERYPREIDTLLLDHLTSVICKSDVFTRHFADAVSWAFADNESLRTILNRLVPIRNSLSHANPLKIHDAERVLCYCDDIVYSLIHFYEARGMANEFNAPLFTKFVDSLGHVENLREPNHQLDYRTLGSLRCGDSLRMEVEGDAHFSPEEYNIKWSMPSLPDGETAQGSSFSLTLLPRHVSEMFMVLATLVSNRDWHRLGMRDAYLDIIYKVLPPID
jgi:hypothetical protein